MKYFTEVVSIYDGYEYTRWDWDKEWLDQEWSHIVGKVRRAIHCRIGLHRDFVNTRTSVATCLWCRRDTDKMPRWYRKIGA